MCIRDSYSYGGQAIAGEQLGEVAHVPLAVVVHVAQEGGNVQIDKIFGVIGDDRGILVPGRQIPQ